MSPRSTGRRGRFAAGEKLFGVSVAPKLSASFGEEPDVIDCDSHGCGCQSDNEHRADLLELAPEESDFRGGDWFRQKRRQMLAADLQEKGRC